MRCVDLGQTWAALRDWLDRADVLILPQLDRWDGPTVRLDADVDRSRPAAPAEVDRVVGLVRAVVQRFRVPAVYVGQTAWDTGSLAIVTIRVPAGGVAHELTLVASWYAALLSSDAAPPDASPSGAAPPGPARRSADRNSEWWPAA